MPKTILNLKPFFQSQAFEPGCHPLRNFLSMPIMAEHVVGSMNNGQFGVYSFVLQKSVGVIHWNDFVHIPVDHQQRLR